MPQVFVAEEKGVAWIISFIWQQHLHF